MIRDEVWQIARQVRELTAEVERIKRSQGTVGPQRNEDEHERWLLYELREQQMTELITSMFNAMQLFLQQRAAVPRP